ncbi:MAG: hypothetical protein EOO23_08730, partial [Comamonadaceae bacterium]
MDDGEGFFYFLVAVAMVVVYRSFFGKKDKGGKSAGSGGVIFTPKVKCSQCLGKGWYACKCVGLPRVNYRGEPIMTPCRACNDTGQIRCRPCKGTGLV